jgi:lysozyme
MTMSRIKKSAGVAAVCCTLVGGFEGLRQTAYPDPATRGQPWTVCYGETKGVKRGDFHTVAECKAMLVERLDEFANGVERCVKVPLSDGAYAASVSLAYNIGIGAFCKSSAVRLFNAGRPREACDAFVKWNRAAGVVFPGLTRRRQAERDLCRAGA